MPRGKKGSKYSGKLKVSPNTMGDVLHPSTPIIFHFAYFTFFFLKKISSLLFNNLSHFTSQHHIAFFFTSFSLKAYFLSSATS